MPGNTKKSQSFERVVRLAGIDGIRRYIAFKAVTISKDSPNGVVTCVGAGARVLASQQGGYPDLAVMLDGKMLHFIPTVIKNDRACLFSPARRNF